jgi:hypothetical protein
MDFIKRRARILFVPLFLIAVAGGLIATLTGHRTVGVVVACVAGVGAILVGDIATGGQAPYSDTGTSTFGDIPDHGTPGGHGS